MKDTADPQIALQIRERFKKYDQAFNKNDATAIAALFTRRASGNAGRIVIRSARNRKKVCRTGVSTIEWQQPFHQNR